MLPSNKTYKIVNAKTGTVLDLSGSDNQFVNGGTWNAGDNQKWRVDEANGGWMLRNIATGLYLGIKGDACNGTPATTVGQAFQWHIRPHEVESSAFRLFIPNTNYNLDLTGSNPTPGTPIIVWPKLCPGHNQAWRFEEE